MNRGLGSTNVNPEVPIIVPKVSRARPQLCSTGFKRINAVEAHEPVSYNPTPLFKRIKKQNHSESLSVFKKLSTKTNWTAKEDQQLIRLVKLNGAKEWSKIAQFFNNRIGKQCRERWFNHLCPDINKSKWTAKEDQALINAHKRFGNKWAAIARLMPGRTDNCIKNHWNSTIKRRLALEKFTNQLKAEALANKTVSAVDTGFCYDKVENNGRPETRCEMTPTSKSQVTDMGNGFKIKEDLFSECDDDNGQEEMRLRVHNPRLVLKDRSSLMAELKSIVEGQKTRSGSLLATEADFAKLISKIEG